MAVIFIWFSKYRSIGNVQTLPSDSYWWKKQLGYTFWFSGMAASWEHLFKQVIVPCLHQGV